MDNFDKVALLFETLRGPEQQLINRKISHIKLSKPYDYLTRLAASISKTEDEEKVIEQFTQLDFMSVKTYEQAMLIELEIRRLNYSLALSPSFNPFLLDENARNYSVKNIGELVVEINGQKVPLSEFTNDQNTLSANRKKTLRIQACKWYNEAKMVILDMIETSKIIIKNITKVKINYYSLGLEFFVMLLLSIFLVGDILLSDVNLYRLDPTNTWYNVGIFIVLLATAFLAIVRRIYRTYPYRMASKVKKQIEQETALLKSLDDMNAKFIEIINNKGQGASGFDVLIKKISVINDKRNVTTNQLLDYAYNPKEYFYRTHQELLLANNLVFALGFLVAVLVLVALSIG